MTEKNTILLADTATMRGETTTADGVLKLTESFQALGVV